ncbi:MAG: hypothetical protein AB8C84_12395 [Oligoflexales bacterium]
MKLLRSLLCVLCVYSHTVFAVIRFEKSDQTVLESERSQPKIQGARTSFSALRPQLQAMKCWNKLYPKTVTGAQIQSDWLFTPWTSYGFSMGYNSTRGRTAQWAQSGAQNREITEASCDDLELTDEESQFVFLPLSLHVGARFSPFEQRFVGVSAWLGYEEVYYQEVRSPLEDESEGTPSINTGWSGGMKLGMSVDFLINFLDQKSLYALHHTTDFRRIYFSVFSEFTTDLGQERLFLTARKKSAVNFARQTYGVSFVFET